MTRVLDTYIVAAVLDSTSLSLHEIQKTEALSTFFRKWGSIICLSSILKSFIITDLLPSNP